MQPIEIAAGEDHLHGLPNVQQQFGEGMRLIENGNFRAAMKQCVRMPHEIEGERRYGNYSRESERRKPPEGVAPRLKKPVDEDQKHQRGHHPVSDISVKT